MFKKSITRVSSFLLAMFILSTMAVPVLADTVDKEYYKSSISAGTWISTVGRTKENYSSVFVMPSIAPNGISKMQTICNDNWTKLPSNKTQNGTVSLKNNQPYAIYNNILEEGDRTTAGVFMWLAMTPSSGSGEMKGVWSPDYSYVGNIIEV